MEKPEPQRWLPCHVDVMFFKAIGPDERKRSLRQSQG